MVSVRFADEPSPVRLSEQTKLLLLGRLLLEPGALVTTDALAHALWGEDDRASRATACSTRSAAARKALGDTAPTPAGHRARRRRVSHRRDRTRCGSTPSASSALAARGHAARRERPRAARAMLAEALCGVGRPAARRARRLPWAAGHAAELDRLRDGAEVDLNEVRLALGEHAELDARAAPADRRSTRSTSACAGSSSARCSAPAARPRRRSAYREAVRELGGVGPGAARARRAGARAACAIAPRPPSRRPTALRHRAGRAAASCSARPRSCAIARPHAAGPSARCA